MNQRGPPGRRGLWRGSRDGSTVIVALPCRRKNQTGRFTDHIDESKALWVYFTRGERTRSDANEEELDARDIGPEESTVGSFSNCPLKEASGTGCPSSSLTFTVNISG